MCFSDLFKQPKIAAPMLPAPPGQSSTRAGDIAARFRQARAGAATTILTSPVGIPAKAQMGAA